LVQTPLTQNKTKKHKSVTLLAGKIGENFDMFECNNDFSDTTQKAESMKETINKLDFRKIKNLYFVKVNAKRMKRQVRDPEKIFTKDSPDKRLLSKYTKKVKA
jgi:hypothetical protein